jgi:hypothetical protein
MVTEYERVAVVVPKELKRAMIDYSAKTGRNLTWCVNTLLSKLVRGEIDLDCASDHTRKKRVALQEVSRGGK